MERVGVYVVGGVPPSWEQTLLAVTLPFYECWITYGTVGKLWVLPNAPRDRGHRGTSAVRQVAATRRRRQPSKPDHRPGRCDETQGRAALAAFGSERQVNGLGVDTRGDRVDVLPEMIAGRGVDPIAWFGVRLFADGWTPDRPATDPEDLVLAVELLASQRDPYRRLSRLFHLLGRRDE